MILALYYVNPPFSSEQLCWIMFNFCSFINSCSKEVIMTVHTDGKIYENKNLLIFRVGIRFKNYFLQKSLALLFWIFYYSNTGVQQYSHF